MGLPDEHIRAHARTVPSARYRSPETFLSALQADDAPTERLVVDELDVLLLRNDPADDAAERPWAQGVGTIFGEFAARRGVIVLNDPIGLSNRLNKLYFQNFPQEVRPVTLVSRQRDEIREFVREQKGKAVLKPLQGSGGTSVFLVESDEAANLNQIIDAIARDGYVVAQEYLSDAARGDTRLFLLNGVPLEYDGCFAALHRTQAQGDLRSNMHVGGKAVKATVDAAVLRVAELVRPRLMADGMFFVGIDVVGDKLMEVNVFSPGGLHSASMLMDVDFSVAVIEAIERKVAIRDDYQGKFSNAELAVM